MSELGHRQDTMEDTRRNEISDSPKPSQPTPFSIADILSRSSSHSSLEVRNSEGEDPQDVKKSEEIVPRFGRMPSPELNVVRELDLLRRNFSQGLEFGANLANLSSYKQNGFGTQIFGYQKSKDGQRQQDEALDMSKSKYLGEEGGFFDAFVFELECCHFA